MQLRLATPAADPSHARQTETRPRHLEDWLGRLPVASVQASSHALLASLTSLNRQSLAGDSRLELLELYRTTAHKLIGVFQLELAGTALPLPGRQRQHAALARDMLIELAYGYKLVLLEGGAGLLRFSRRRDPALTLQRILAAQLRTLILCYETYAPVPAGLWSEMHQIYRYACEQALQDQLVADSPPASASQTYRLALLLATADPYHLVQGDISKILDLLRQCGGLAQVLAPAPSARADGLFLVQLNSDQPPVSLSRHHKVIDPDHDRFLNTLALAGQVHQTLARLKSGEPANTTGLPPYASEPAYQGLLRRLLRNWGTPHQRGFNRYEADTGKVTLCTGIQTIHTLLESACDGNQAAAHPPHTSEIAIDTLSPIEQGRHRNASTTHWDIINNSAGGLSLRSQGEPHAHVKVGEVVALRGGPSPRWNIGVVRWLQNPTADLIECGVQMLSPGARPAWVRNRMATIRTRQPAILLPANAALQLPQRLLAPRRIYLRDVPIELYLGASTLVILPQKLVEQTPVCDLFEFQEISQEPG